MKYTGKTPDNRKKSLRKGPRLGLHSYQVPTNSTWRRKNSSFRRIWSSISLNITCGKIFYKDIYNNITGITIMFFILRYSKKKQWDNFKENNLVFQMTFLKWLSKRPLVFAMSKINNYTTAAISGLGCFLNVAPNKGLQNTSKYANQLSGFVCFKLYWVSEPVCFRVSWENKTTAW